MYNCSISSQKHCFSYLLEQKNVFYRVFRTKCRCGSNYMWFWRRSVSGVYSVDDEAFHQSKIIWKIISKYLLNYLIFNWTFPIFVKQFSRTTSTRYKLCSFMESRHYLLFLLRCVTTFFECEMKIPFNRIVSESKNMESSESASTKNSRF